MKQIIVLMVLFVLMGGVANAQLINRGDIDKKTNVVAGKSYNVATVESLPQTLAQIIRVFLGTLGIIFVVLIISAGWNWFIAGGEATKIKLAKDRMINATIGLVIIISAYSLTYFVFKQADNLGVVGGTGAPNGSDITQSP